MTTATINHSNGNKAPLHCEKKGGVWDRKLLPMESTIKMIGCTHPGSNNNEKNMAAVIKHHCSGKNKLRYITETYLIWNRRSNGWSQSSSKWQQRETKKQQITTTTVVNSYCAEKMTLEYVIAKKDQWDWQ